MGKNKKENDKKILTLYLDKDLIFKLKEIALYSHTNVSKIAEDCFKDFIKKNNIVK